MPCTAQAQKKVLFLSLGITVPVVDLCKNQEKYYVIRREILFLDFKTTVVLGCPKMLSISGRVEK